ncbi:MAG: AbrB/MazE/SpoVT family DNA-binding domain-containing protein [Propionibacteriaceae bacterium]|jgi:AbrB family looped-hinge helix DNA binding protein|nr:AbrB/MazE/SpoVT family DNA-binding domain-containing protein [Propionibacteriaceae bacterium]
MEATIDTVGRILVPKALRTALGLLPGTRVDISAYGNGVQITPGGRAARLVEEDGWLVVDSGVELDDATMFGLIDAGRR